MVLQNEVGETEVTVRVHDEKGDTYLCNGLMKSVGCPVTGGTLDPEAEDPFEVGSAEVELQLLGYHGSVGKVTAWLHSSKLGQQYVMRECEPLKAWARFEEDDTYYFAIGL